VCGFGQDATASVVRGRPASIKAVIRRGQGRGARGHVCSSELDYDSGKGGPCSPAAIDWGPCARPLCGEKPLNGGGCWTARISSFYMRSPRTVHRRAARERGGETAF